MAVVWLLWWLREGVIIIGHFGAVIINEAVATLTLGMHTDNVESGREQMYTEDNVMRVTHMSCNCKVILRTEETKNSDEEKSGS